MTMKTLLTAALGATFPLLTLAKTPYPIRPPGSISRLAARDDVPNILNITTWNDLVDGVCKDVTVIYARGTGEAGNVGSLVGPPFFQQLYDQIGEDYIALQGVDYAATDEGYFEGGDPEGAATLANLTALAVEQCPGTQIVLSGYSQGAQVVHLGTAELTADQSAEVAAVVMFGDPDDGQELQDIDEDIVKTYCFSGDYICQGITEITIWHLEYKVFAPEAAEFVAGLVTVG